MLQLPLLESDLQEVVHPPGPWILRCESDERAPGSYCFAWTKELPAGATVRDFLQVIYSNRAYETLDPYQVPSGHYIRNADKYPVFRLCWGK
jgi:hypothetical protein